MGADIHADIFSYNQNEKVNNALSEEFLKRLLWIDLVQNFD